MKPYTDDMMVSASTTAAVVLHKSSVGLGNGLDKGLPAEVLTPFPGVEV